MSLRRTLEQFRISGKRDVMGFGTRPSAFFRSRKNLRASRSAFFRNGQKRFWPKWVLAGTEKVQHRRYWVFSRAEKELERRQLFFSEVAGGILAKTVFCRDGKSSITTLSGLFRNGKNARASPIVFFRGCKNLFWPKKVFAEPEKSCFASV